ncbi:zeta toxin family protein [soil metagenome]
MTKISPKRIRFFAGPNGSGKTTIINAVRKKKDVRLGCYINADDIERRLIQSRKILLRFYNVEINDSEVFYKFVDKHGLTLKGKVPDLRSILKVNRRSIAFTGKGKMNSYIAAVIADFLRETLLNCLESFSFETVMSDERKVDLAKRAKEKGYRVYLYFVATIDPEINIKRVSQRVKLGGHKVDSKLIRKRYERSLSLLYKMVRLTDRAYIFDNSGNEYELVAEITGGKELKISDSGKGIPNWFYNYFYKKAIRQKH